MGVAIDGARAVCDGSSFIWILRRYVVAAGLSVGCVLVSKDYVLVVVW